MRSGTFVKQASGYDAFIPRPLPPDPPVQIDSEMAHLLSEADRALGRLDGITSVLPNPDLFVGMYVRQEAVLSSQIEGTQSTLEDVLQFEMDSSGKAVPKDVGVVVNYVRAMNYGLDRLDKLPLSMRLIREIHAELLRGARGGNREPGEFRRTQNWIGPTGCSLMTATFVPPPVPEMKEAIGELEKFLHFEGLMPALIHCGLAHAQFETIHPFLDGNGRVGRLLIAFLLCERKILHRPLLYLSLYLKRHRSQYYDRLMASRSEGDWEGWLKFFLRGVAEVSQTATETGRKILTLREDGRKIILRAFGNSALAQRLFDYLFEQPMFNVRMVEKHLGCSFAKANQLVVQMEAYRLLKETTGWQRNRRYKFWPYLDLFEEKSAHAAQVEWVPDKAIEPGSGTARG
jgi:Fic family protein